MEHEQTPSCGTILRHLREERGWSLQELVKQLGRLYRQENEKLCPLTISMVGKWERDEHLPCPTYRKLFCLLYRQTATELGFLVPQSPTVLSPAREAGVCILSDRTVPIANDGLLTPWRAGSLLNPTRKRHSFLPWKPPARNEHAMSSYPNDVRGNLREDWSAAPRLPVNKPPNGC